MKISAITARSPRRMLLFIVVLFIVVLFSVVLFSEVLSNAVFLGAVRFSAAMADSMLLSLYADLVDADVVSSEAIICVECTSEAAARDVALRHVSQQECHSSSGRPQDDAFCRTFQKQVLVLSPYKNHIYRYMVGAQHDGLPKVLREGDSLSMHEQYAYTELMQTFRDLVAFYRDFSMVALRTPVANAAPGARAAPGVSAALDPDNPYYSDGGCYVNTALNLVNDPDMQRNVYNQLITQALEAPNSPFGQRYRKHLEAKGIQHQLTSAELGITILNSDFNVAASWTNKTADEFALRVWFQVSEVEATQSHDIVYFKISNTGIHNGMKSYKSLDGSGEYSTNVPIFITEIDLDKSIILSKVGLEALQNPQVFNNDCVKKALAKGLENGEFWAEKRAGGDGFNLMTNRYSVYIPHPVTRLCDTLHNIQPEFAPQWLSSTCKS